LEEAMVASKVLRSKTSTASAKTLAGSALTQRPDHAKGPFRERYGK